MDSQSSSLTKLVEGTTGVTGGDPNPREPSKAPKGETIPGGFNPDKKLDPLSSPGS